MLEVNQAYQMDVLDFYATFEDESVDLVVTDPPYRMTKNGKSCRPNYMHNSMKPNWFGGELPETKKWLSETYRVLKQRTHFYTFTNTNSITEYLAIASEVGFQLHNILSMIKDTNMPSRWYYKQTELVLFFRKGRAKPINNLSSPDHFNVMMPLARTGKRHITQKPLSFVSMLIANSSLQDELVVDPFVGSGTTVFAAKELDRRFLCADNGINPKNDMSWADLVNLQLENHLYDAGADGSPLERFLAGLGEND